MNFYLENDICDFFDISIVLPFYKKLNEFKRVLPNNLKYFQRNGIELIIVLDTPDEEHELVNYLDEFPFLNSKVIVNRIDHEWRNPAKALNVGIRHASRKYIFVASPETEFLTDVIYQLRYILNYHQESYVIGQVTFLDFDTSPLLEKIQHYELLPYGSFMVEKKYLEQVQGYAEKLNSWGGDDDNMRARLDLLGLKRMFVSQAIAIHREENAKGHEARYKKNAEMPLLAYRDIYYPQQLIVNDDTWGTDFNDLAYSWELRNSKKRQCESYLKAFKKYWIKNDAVFDQAYKIIALIQVKNEIRHIPEVLAHLDKYCDGIILLDDDSTDGSYEAAMSEKLLLKVQIKGTDLFNDLNLRNTCLELAAFFNIEWLFFFDADERFDARYVDLYSLTDRNEVDSVCFYVVHLWDNEYSYKIKLPESDNGLLSRWRMFRAYGKLEIIANRLLHFPATPFKQNRLDAKVLIRHYGNIDAANRKIKYERYITQDKEGLTQGYSYEYLVEENSVLRDIGTLTL